MAREFRIVTDGRRFVVQHLDRFLWWTWWRDVVLMDESTASFDSLEGAREWIREYGAPRKWRVVAEGE